MKQIREKLFKISEDYFNYMAENYPVMCASDEFYFFPRAKKALSYFKYLDSLGQDKINQDVSYIKKLKNKIERLNARNLNLEAKIDIALLNQSMRSYLREFEQVKIWRKDPNIYLKICLFGISQILTKSLFIKTDSGQVLVSRIKKIPLLLTEAKINLTQIPRIYKQVSIEMVNVLIGYFKEDLFGFLNKTLTTKDAKSLIKPVILSLEEFRSFVKANLSQKEFLEDKVLLKDLLETSFSYKRDLEEIFEIAQDEYENTLGRMRRLALKIDSQKKWQQILSEYRLNIKKPKELLKLYSSQINKIKNFLVKKDAISIPKTQEIKVIETPRYLMPLRASASYSCPLTKNPKEQGIFYVTVYFDKDKGLLQRYFNNVHLEYVFVSAHEAFPGHHLLDSKRKDLKSPIRQQIESALFYEGWASYIETLIVKLGYMNDPIQDLIGLRRQAWRAVRAMLDVGIRIKKLKLEDADKKLKGLGYSSNIVKQMLGHYRITYGYQLCYTMGKFEIERLRKKFVPKFGLKRFHDSVLSSGQIPFDLLERRLERLNGK